MRWSFLLLLLLLLLGAATAVMAAADEEVLALAAEAPSTSTINNDDWRRLLPDESVPRGSHVRLDMTSGEKWVKIVPLASPQAELTRGQQILHVLQVDDALLPRIQEIRDALARTNDTVQFELDAVEMWDLRQNVLRKDADSRKSPAERLALELKSNGTAAAAALEKLDELVEEIDFARQFARHGGLGELLRLAEEDESQSAFAALTVLAKAVKYIPDLQDELFKLGALERVWALHLRTADDKRRAQVVAVYGAMLRGSGKRGSKLLKKRAPEVFPALQRWAESDADAKVRTRASNLVDDLLAEGFSA